MVNKLFTIILSILTIHSLGQNVEFIKTFEYDLYPQNVKAFEATDSTWICTNLDIETNQLRLVKIIETNNTIESEIFSLDDELYHIGQGVLLLEACNESSIIGVSNAINKQDSTQHILYWAMQDGEITQTTSLASSQNISSIGGVNLYCPMENGNQLVGCSFSHQSENKGFSLIEIEIGGTIAKKDTLILPLEFYGVDEMQVKDGKFYLSDSWHSILHSDVNNITDLDTLWAAPYTSFSDTALVSCLLLGFEVISSNKIIASINARVDYDPSIWVNRRTTSFIVEIDGDSNLTFLESFKTVDTLQSGILDNKHVFGTEGSFNVQSDGSYYHTWISNFESQFSSFYKPEYTTINVAKMTLEDGTVWEYEYVEQVDSSRLILFETLPISDGGLLVFSRKYNYKQNPLEEGTLHVIRLRPDGTVHTLDVQETHNQSQKSIVSPNPADQFVQIMGDVSLGDQYRIHDINGKLHQSGHNTTRISTENLKSGIYLFSILKKDGSRFTDKLIIAH